MPGYERTLVRGLLPVAVLLIGAATSSARAQDEILRYVLRPLPEEGRLEVELTWETQDRRASRLCVAPQWGTVDDVPGLLRNIKFDGARSVRRDGACWVVKHRKDAEIICRYVVAPGKREFDWNTTHHPLTTEKFFHGVGNAFLMTPGVGGELPEEYQVLLRWELPEGWEAVCSWSRGRVVAARMEPVDLRHSVYLAGVLKTYVTQVRGANELTVALVDEFKFTPAEFAELAADIIAAECAFLSEQEFPPFVVTAIPVGEAIKEGDSRLSGVGLFRSFALTVAPQATLTDGVEQLFAHELFHYWNGGVLPAAEPVKLVYWFVEGFTDYYAMRILWESGRWSAQTYADWLNRIIREYHSNPARNVSNEVIADQFWSARDTVGEVPYQRGLMLALRWHKRAQERGVSAGLDKLFLTLVERGRAGDFEVSNAGVRQAGRELLGGWFATDFGRFVVDGETVEVQRDALEPAFEGRQRTVYAFDLGFDRERSLAEQRVCGLEVGSAAAKAGLREGEVLVGWDLHGDPERQIVVQIKRDGRVRTIRYYPRGESQKVLQFSPAEK